MAAVNRTLKRTGEIAGDAGDLTSFTDSARQTFVDVVIQVWNEAIHELYGLGALQGEVEEDTITLVADQNDYDLPNDFEALAGKTYLSRALVNAADGHVLREYPGGFDQLYVDQPDPTDFTGQPHHFVFNPIVNEFRIDTMPTSDEAGDEYKFLFEKRISLTKPTDKFPFTDTGVDGLMPVVAEVARLSLTGKPRDPLSANAGFNRALATIVQKKARTSYGTHRAQAG